MRITIAINLKTHQWITAPWGRGYVLVGKNDGHTCVDAKCYGKQ